MTRPTTQEYQDYLEGVESRSALGLTRHEADECRSIVSAIILNLQTLNYGLAMQHAEILSRKIR